MAREGDAFASVNPFSADGPPDDVCNKTLNLIYLYEDFVWLVEFQRFMYVLCGADLRMDISGYGFNALSSRDSTYKVILVS